MKRCIVLSICVLVLFSCKKKEPQPAAPAGTAVNVPPDCGESFIATRDIRVGETGIYLPAGSKICIAPDAGKVQVELPAGYSFLLADGSARPLPVTIATYTCTCSVPGNNCQVFYAEGAGFGCLQRSCSGSCTGKFTYGGYVVDRVISTTDQKIFFSSEAIQKLIQGLAAARTVNTVFQLLGVRFVLGTEDLPPAASCACEGTSACTLKTLSLKDSRVKIYYCEGKCNGCELTVN